MALYKVIFMPSVEKDLRRLPRGVASRVVKRVEELGIKPIGRGMVKLSGSNALYRVRVGNYRIVYEFDSQAEIITIHYVRHRGKAYRTK